MGGTPTTRLNCPQHRPRHAGGRSEAGHRPATLDVSVDGPERWRDVKVCKAGQEAARAADAVKELRRITSKSRSSKRRSRATSRPGRFERVTATVTAVSLSPRRCGAERPQKRSGETQGSPQGKAFPSSFRLHA